MAFIVIPFVEIAVLIQVGGLIGIGPTLALIVLTAIVGIWMLRRQGFAVLMRAQTQLEQGVVPVTEVFEGFCLVIAGALLLTPGFVTDTIGGLLLLPPVRAMLYRLLGREIAVVARGATRPQGRGGKTVIVEGQYREIEPDNPAIDIQDDQEDDGPMPPPRGSWNRKP